MSVEVGEKMQHDIHQRRLESGVKPGWLGKSGVDTWAALASESWSESLNGR